MRLLCLGLDGADYDLVRELIANGRLPTLARLSREGVFGRFARRFPPSRPTAWSSFLTGLNPAGHGIFNFSTNPNRGPQTRRERSQSRRDADLAAARQRRHPLGVRRDPVHVPGGADRRHRRHRLRRPRAAADPAGGGPGADPRGLPRPRHRAPPDGRALVGGLRGIRRPAGRARRADAGVCRLALELEPDLQLLCVDFMSADHAGHLGYARFDPDHPAHDPTQAGDELVQVYERGRRACGELIEVAGRGTARSRPPRVLGPRHEADLLDVPREPLARGGGTPPLSSPLAAAAEGRIARRRWPRSTSGSREPPAATARASTSCRSCRGPRADRAFADIDFGSTRAYCFATRGPDLPRRGERRASDPAYADASRTSSPRSATPRPASRRSTCGGRRSCTTGPYIDKAPELVILPRDERIHVDSSRRALADRVRAPRRRSTRELSTATRATTALTGILAAAGPGIQPRRRSAEAPRSSSCRRRSSACSASRRTASTARRSTRSSGRRRGRVERASTAARRTTPASEPRLHRGGGSASWSSSSATSATSSLSASEHRAARYSGPVAAGRTKTSRP